MKKIPPLPERGEPFIVSDNLVKIYKVADLEVVALQGLDLEVARGEIMAIIGNSGSGKSTLLNTLGRTRPAKRRYTDRWQSEPGQDVGRRPGLV